MQALLVRVGIDLSEKSGGWNAPVNPDTDEFAYVPILEDEGKGKKKIRPQFKDKVFYKYKQFEIPCRKLCRKLPVKFKDKYAHLDPDFKYLTYGDEGDRGKPIRELANGDILAFYASLSPVKPCNQKLIYALIGLYVVDRIKPALDIPPEDWDKNAHTRREPDETDIVVFAKPKPGLSGRLERCIPIGSYRKGGKHQKKAYWLEEEFSDKWGRLSTSADFLHPTDYLQRSPRLLHFSEPERFYKWFKEQNIRLVARNNVMTSI
jgi:hypothetical protein